MNEQNQENQEVNNVQNQGEQQVNVEKEETKVEKAENQENQKKDGNQTAETQEEPQIAADVPETESAETASAQSTEEKPIGNVFYEEPKKHSGKKKSMIITIIAIIIVLVLAGVAAYFYLENTKGKRFIKMMTNDYLFEIPKCSSEIAENNNKVDFKLEVDADEMMEQLGETNKNVGKLSIRNYLTKKGNDFSGILTLNSNEDIVAELKYLKNDSKLGVMVTDLFNKYAVLDLGDIEGIANKLNIDEERINELKNSALNYAENLIEFKLVSAKYEDILEKHINQNISSMRGVNVDINNEWVSTKKTTLTLSYEELLTLGKELLTIMKDDEALYKLLAKQDSFEYTYEEWQSELEQLYTEITDALEKDEIPDNKLLVDVYQNGRNTVCIKLSLTAENEEQVALRISALNKEETSYFEVEIGATGNTLKIYADAYKKDSTLDADVYFAVENAGETQKIRLFKFTVEGQKDSSVQVDQLTPDMLVINTAADDEIKTFENDIKKNTLGFIIKAASKLPRNIGDFIDSIGDLNYGSDMYEDDLDYDYDFDDESGDVLYEYDEISGDALSGEETYYYEGMDEEFGI